MPVTILMPALSPTMTEGNLVKWLKQEGESVKAGQVIAEIETDKATMEVEAVDEGILGKIIVAAGTENVKVNEVIAFILEEGEDVSNIVMPVSQSNTEIVPANLSILPGTNIITESEKPTNNSPKRVFATPLAKRIAAQMQIDITTIKGSGPHGRIIKADIENYQSAFAASTVVGIQTNYQDIKISSMRKTIAKRLTEAKQNIPHFYLTVDCQLDELLDIRNKLNQRSNVIRISVNDFVMRACAMALLATSEANVTYHGEFIRQYKQVDICVAVALDGGLVTPIVKSCEKKSLTELAQEIKILADRARNGKLAPEEYQGGSFTVSNLGMFGVKHFAAIINPPQACILAIGAAEKQVVVRDKESIIATIMTCTLSIDHRALDGAVGAKFLKVFKEYIEAPAQLLM